MHYMFHVFYGELIYHELERFSDLLAVLTYIHTVSGTHLLSPFAISCEGPSWSSSSIFREKVMGTLNNVSD